MLAVIACSGGGGNSDAATGGAASGGGAPASGGAAGGSETGGSGGSAGFASGGRTGGTGGTSGDLGGSAGAGSRNSAIGGTAETAVGGTGTGAEAGGGGDGGSGGGQSGSGGTPDNAAIKIVILGASSAAGKNLDEPTYGGEVGGLVGSWANRLAATLAQQRPGSQVVNLAKPGYNTYHALPTGTANPTGAPDVDPARNITAALLEHPDALIISFPGGGEVALGDDASDIVSNLRIIVDAALAAGVPSWVATTQPHVDQTPEDIVFGLGYRQATLDEFGEFALDFWTPLALPDNSGAQPTLLLTDNTHPNKLGHEALYDVVIAADIPAVALDW